MRVELKSVNLEAGCFSCVSFPRHCGPKQPDVPALIIHCSTSGGSKRANGRASDPVIMSGFLVVNWIDRTYLVVWVVFDDFARMSRSAIMAKLLAILKHPVTPTFSSVTHLFRVGCE